MLDGLIEEFGHTTYVSFAVIAARLALAAVYGAVIGFEREWRNQSAGLRTHILICVAAATFGILTVEIVHAPMFAAAEIKDSIKVDPIRVVEAVTAGVAFLAAGTVIFTRGEVKGLTTGAGMWLAGAIGLASGFGFWHLAALATGLTFIVLGLMHSLERKVDPDGEGDEIKPDPKGDKATHARPDNPSEFEPAHTDRAG